MQIYGFWVGAFRVFLDEVEGSGCSVFGSGIKVCRVMIYEGRGLRVWRLGSSCVRGFGL